MPRAIVYIRVSTDDQKDSGLGLEAQEHACRAWAEARGFTVVGPLQESEAVCGATPLDRRPRLVEAIGTAGEGDVVLVAKRDRVARDRLITGSIEAVLKKRGARLVSAAGEGTEDAADESAGFLSRGVVDLFAEHERLTIKSRTRQALAVKRRRGERTGGVPYGWEVDPDSPRTTKTERPCGLKPHPVEQERLRLIRALAGEGLSAAAVARRLNDQAVPTKTGRGPWTRQTVTQILKRKP